jgi:poly(3-hydroxybutyrate) depolymerase
MKTTKHLRTPTLILVLISLFGSLVSVDAQNRWSRKVKEVYYKSIADNSSQPTYVYAPKGQAGKRPLLVALHTWSDDFQQEGGQPLFGDWCIQNDWFLIHPNFRGKNKTPKALGSDLAVADIVSAVEFMKSKYDVDENRIYLCGVSGGGHMSLLMAGRHPEIWAGVSAWCGITDIQAWWEQKSDVGPERYAKEIEKACGGKPGIDEEATAQARYRSPLTYLSKAGAVSLDINTGIDDGRKGSVPFTHSLYAFNRVVAGTDALSQEQIDSFYETQKVPAELQSTIEDPVYGKYKPLFRKATDTCRITVFDGAHLINHGAALNWLKMQEKGKPTVWVVKDIIKIR